MTDFHDQPCAAPGLDSYRYRGRYGWIMIGAINDEDALHEAGRSHAGGLTFANLERWDGARYVPVREANAGARVFANIKITPAHDDAAGMLRAALNSGMRHPQFELSAILPVILKR